MPSTTARDLRRRGSVRFATLAGVTCLVAALAACAPSDEADSSATATSASCAKADLALKSAGSLTIGTDKPAYSPWFEDDDPTNGKGYESAVAYAVAQKLGFSKDEVAWTTIGFNAAFAPGPKTFDFDVNQVSINDERKQAVDFSSGYYDVTQAVITKAGSKIENATTIADLKDAKLGAQVGTTSYDAIVDTIKPSSDPAVFDTNDLAKLALDNGSVDGLVVDLPTGLYLTAAEIDGGKVVGQLPAGAGAEQFGLVLAKGSALTSCVSQAVDALRSDGTLDELQTQWLTTSAGAPELK